MLELENLSRRLNCKARILAKLEYLNPTGSSKGRAAMGMIEAAEADGRLAPGGAIIEPTSGNMGIALAALAAARGYTFIAVMPENMSMERRRLIGAYGAEIVLTPAADGMSGAVEKARELASAMPGAIIPDQFSNPANAAAHYRSTAQEIWQCTHGMIDIFTAGVGTGGTITGVGRFLKEHRKSIKVIAVEPASSPVLSGGKKGSHKIQGIGAGFVPELLDTSVYDEVAPVSDEEAMYMARLMARTEGILVGISSGAALAAACKAGKDPENEGKNIVALLPDGGERYLSTELFQQQGHD